jgi:hypothetical protein
MPKKVILSLIQLVKTTQLDRNGFQRVYFPNSTSTNTLMSQVLITLVINRKDSLETDIRLYNFLEISVQVHREGQTHGQRATTDL